MNCSVNDFYMMAQIHNEITIKNTVLCNLTRAIQSVQQYYLQKESALTNSDYQAHELCQQFDNILLYGLKRINDSYYKVVIEFTHKDVINETSKLLNLTTNFGRARAWLYHAFNDNLMESYLKCFLENKKFLLQHYKKESFVIDVQTLNVLITLVSGLENVQFKLFSDVPYLDTSCWPTHLYAKRDLIQQQLNILNQQEPKFDMNNITKNETRTSNQKSSSRRRKGSKKQHINNVSLDSNSSTNYSDLYSNDIGNDSDIDQTNKLKINQQNNNKNNNKSDIESNLTESLDVTQYTSLASSIKNNNNSLINYMNNNNNNNGAQRVKASSTSSVSSSEGLISSSATSSNYNKAKEYNNKSIEIDIEINKLREVAVATNAISPSKKLSETPRKPSLLNAFNNSPSQQALENISQEKFDKKIKDIENYSDIIENAASKMDECFKSMTEVYQSYDENRFYIESPGYDETILLANNNNNNNNNNQSVSVKDSEDIEKSLYDIYPHEEENNFNKIEQKKDIIKIEDKNCNTLTSFDEKLKLDLRQAIKIDNNTKLMLQINFLQNDQNEEIINMYHVTRGHCQGEIEEVFLLLTSYAIYILLRNNTNADNIFKKEAVINHNEIDYIEVSLNSQAFHILCLNRRKHYWFTTASRTLTDEILTNLQISRERSNLKLPLLSILRDATTQKIAIKKFIANNENISPQDFDIKTYSLVFWEDQASATAQIIQKEGYLLYFLKTGSSNNIEWKRAYFVLKNDVLSQFRDQNEKRAHHIIKLSDEFSGCRKSSNSGRQYTIELILSNSTTLYLSAKNEVEASEWLQSFCKSISLGNYNTDVPINSCLPCCSVITNKKIYYCHENLDTNFYRLLDVIKLEEIIKISYDITCKYFCIIYVESENKKQKYWFVYFVDEIERNSFINSMKTTWESLFQIQFTIEKLNNKELLKRCQNGLNVINNTWQNYSIKSD